MSFEVGRRSVIGGMTAAGAFFAAARAVRGATPRRGGTLRMAMPYNPGTVDPMTGRNGPDFNVLYAVFDPLIDFDPKSLELKPGLAARWRFVDPKTLVLDLQKGVRFHDGSAFDAEAVKFNLDRCAEDKRSNVKADLVTIDHVEVADAHKIALHLKQPNAGLPAMLTNRIGCVVSPTAVKKQGGNVDRHPVGTGPFRFVDWQDNVSFKLVRNPDYWRAGLPYLDGVDIRIINEPNTLARSVLVGEADVGADLFIQQKLIADRAGGVVTVTSPALTFFGVFLNYANPPLNDVRLRRALNYAINRDEFNAVIMSGFAETTSTILSRKHWACDPETAGFYQHDPETARALVREAGYPNGIDLESYGWPDQMSVQRQELLVSQWARADIRVKVTAVSPQQAMQFFNIEGKKSMSITPTGGFPDPSQDYEALFGKSALRNAGRIELPGFRQLLDATMATDDRAARKAVFAKLQKFVVEPALQVPQVINFAVTALQPRVRNYVLGLLTAPRLREVWVDT
jgi:ABC-type transport system substrate-binding protein